MLNVISSAIEMTKINYKRFALIAATMVAILLAGCFLLGFSERTMMIAGLLSSLWGTGFYIHLKKLDDKNG